MLIGSAMIRLNTSQLTDMDDVYWVDMDKMWPLDARQRRQATTTDVCIRCRQSDRYMTSDVVQTNIASKTKYGYISDSTCWSRSNDLWVMSPTRFLCAKVLAQYASLPKHTQNQPMTHIIPPHRIACVHSVQTDNPHLLPTLHSIAMPASSLIGLLPY